MLRIWPLCDARPLLAMFFFFPATLTSPAFAITLDAIDPLAFAAAGLSTFLAIALAGLLFRLRAAKSKLRSAAEKTAALETLLDESEAAIKSDPQVQLRWLGRSEMPERMTGSMQGSANVPLKTDQFMEFGRWLEPDSAAMLRDGIAGLKDSGTPFNFGIKTIDGDLLDADGRTAGGIAILRLRPLAGERRQITQLTYDAGKLAKQVERLSAVLDRAPFPIWLKGKDNALQWVNQAYVRATEAQGIEDVLKKDIRIAKDQDIEKPALGDAQDEAPGFAGRVDTVLSGNKRTLNIFEITENNTSAGFAIDVTGVAQAEKELERHIQAHNSTLNRIDTAIAIFGQDQRLMFFNNAYLTLWALDEDWLKTRPSDGEILDALRARRTLPEQEDYRKWRAEQLKVYTTLEPQQPVAWYLPDGRSLRVVSEQHPFGGITTLYENLTKEFQLESSYNKLIGEQRETLDNLAEAVSLFRSDGRLKLFNPAFGKFWSPEGQFLVDQPHIGVLASLPHLGADARNAWQDIGYAVTAVGEERRPLEGRFLHAGYVLRFRSVPLPDGNSLVTFADMSDAAKAEQALRERADALEAADRLKTDFLQNVSYEIRTPLTSILGFAETLFYGLAGPLTQRQMDNVRDIHEASSDLKAIIDGIIDLSTIDAGAMELHLQDINVEELLERVAERSKVQMSRKQLNISIEIGNAAGHMVGDVVRLEQMLGHLLSNAIGFSPEGSSIRMGAKRTKDRIQLWVSDQGKGLDPEIKDVAFKRFTSKPLPGNHRGAGLGLAIVKSFTDLHGGHVTLASKPDLGTTVMCELPIEGPVARQQLA
jgi:signal transduction histidine kinase